MYTGEGGGESEGERDTAYREVKNMVKGGTWI